MPLAAFAQSRGSVSPKNEVIPHRQDNSEFSAAKNQGHRLASTTDCGKELMFGYSENMFPPNIYFGAAHKEVLAMWFVAPASGTIDTLFLDIHETGKLDSVISLGIFKSNVYPRHGPAYPPYPPPSCLPWGYYKNSNDLDPVGSATFQSQFL